MAIDSLQKVSINNSEQWLLVRGKNKNAPLILQVQAGPGIPQICYAESMQKNLKWEDDYLIVYWDQRACGKSYRKNTDTATISLDQAAEDILACARYLLKTYHRDKLTLVGHSLGATTSLLAASKDSSLFNRLILIGIDIDIERSNQYAFNFALDQAKKKNDKKILKQIADIKNQPIVTAKLFEKKGKIISRYGGIAVSKTYNQLSMDALKNLWQSKAYGIKDILNTVKGIEFCQNVLLPKIEHLNLFKYHISTSVPIHFVQGAKDAVTPTEIMQLYFEHLSVPIKTLTIFENSAHIPQFEEPEKFYRFLNTIIK